MKEKKSIIIVTTIILLIKLLGGFFLHSFTFLSSSLIEIILLTYFLLSNKESDAKSKGILTSIIGLLYLLISLGIVFISIITEPLKPSFWIILFIVICVLAKYAVTSLKINSAYNKRKGELAFSAIKSNLEFISYGIVLGSLILCRLSRFFKILKYADIVGTILITLIVIYFTIKLIANSIKYMEGKKASIPEDYQTEISNRSEVKRIDSLSVKEYGGISKATINIELKEGISLVDVNTFTVTLEDYLLKRVDVTEVNMVTTPEKRKNKPKIVSKKAEAIREAKNKKKPSTNNNQNKGNKNARNSRGRNSKTNAKKKNSSQKNKKR